MFHLRTPTVVSFSYIYILQGSVATQIRRGGIFNNHFIANFPKSASVNLISVNIWRKYGQKLTLLMAHSVYRKYISQPQTTLHRHLLPGGFGHTSHS